MTLALTTLSVLCQLAHGTRGDHHTGGWGSRADYLKILKTALHILKYKSEMSKHKKKKNWKYKKRHWNERPYCLTQSITL